MKIKSLLIGMLACTALVGCSDDDVLNNAEQENQQAEKIDAYLKFSIASSTNSSRADNGNEALQLVIAIKSLNIVDMRMSVPLTKTRSMMC